MVIKEMHCNIIKAINEKPTATLHSNGEKLKAIPPVSGTKQRCALLLLLLNITMKP